MYANTVSERTARLVASDGFGRVRFAAQPWTAATPRTASIPIQTLAQRMTRALAVRAASWWAWWRQRRRARHTRVALHQLDDYLLHDLGLDRSEITAVAAGTCGDAQDTLPHWMPMRSTPPTRDTTRQR